MGYLLLKYIHLLTVATSFALFFVRGMWVMRSYPQSEEAAVRVLPHVVDAVLLLSAAGLVIVSPQKGWPGDWLTVKLALIVVYVALAQGLFRFAGPLMIKLMIWFAGLLVFLFITTIAVLRNPIGIFAVI